MNNEIKVGRQCIVECYAGRKEGTIIEIDGNTVVIQDFWGNKVVLGIDAIKVTWTRVIAVDFDGTLQLGHFPNCGTVNERIKAAIIREKEQGSIIVLWTCREDYPDEGNWYLTEAYGWCLENDIPIDYINEFPKFRTRKVIADEYWDDKAKNVKDVK